MQSFHHLCFLILEEEINREIGFNEHTVIRKVNLLTFFFKKINQSIKLYLVH